VWDVDVGGVDELDGALDAEVVEQSIPHHLSKIRQVAQGRDYRQRFARDL
jgi:hypothetical protein